MVFPRSEHATRGLWPGLQPSAQHQNTYQLLTTVRLHRRLQHLADRNRLPLPFSSLEGKVIMNSKYLLVTLVALAICPFAQAAQNDTTPNAQKSKAPAATHATPPNQGEGSRIFEQNCSRCHDNAPQGYSPRISGTIAMHMRVRASPLSKHDQEELLRFREPLDLGFDDMARLIMNRIQQSDQCGVVRGRQSICRRIARQKTGRVGSPSSHTLPARMPIRPSQPDAPVRPWLASSSMGYSSSKT